jgi:mRNA-degrading endonuclease RelE of RelBE toxin-antitoxin system
MKKAARRERVQLSADDLEAALELLSAEADVRQSYGRELILKVLEYLAIGVFLLTLPLGLLIVWFDTTWGVVLLAVAGSSVIVFIPVSQMSTDLDEAPRKVRDAFGSSDVAQAVEDVWERKSGKLDISIGFIAIFGAAALVAGFVLLLIGLIGSDDVRPLAIILIATPVVFLWGMVAVSNYEEFRYYTQVSQARDRIEHLFSQVTSEGAHDVSLPASDMDVIARAETQHVEGKVADLVGKLPESVWKLYSVAIHPKPLERLDRLSHEQPTAWQTVRAVLDRLQGDPHPAEARHQPGREDEFVVEAGPLAVTYAVDDEARRVDILEIYPTTTNGV